MKTILLLRHSEPIKDRTLPTAELPLSEQGYRKAQELFSLKTFHSVQAVYPRPIGGQPAPQKSCVRISL